MTEQEMMLTHILRCRSIDLVVDKPALSQAQQQQFEDYKRRREDGEPLQYILGSCNFMGLELLVNPSVLIPRPETEQLVDAALGVLRRMSAANPANEHVQILDLGTGSGNIAIALAQFVPQSRIVSVDISLPALEVARANARRHKLEGRIEFIQDDFTVLLPGLRQVFDLVISNPPYIPTGLLSSLPEDVRQEPAGALDGGEDGLDFYRIITKYTPCLLRRGGCLMMEFGDGQADAVTNLVQARNIFSRIEIIKDLAGRDRTIKAVY